VARPQLDVVTGAFSYTGRGYVSELARNFRPYDPL
jgi:hypothetical protein